MSITRSHKRCNRPKVVIFDIKKSDLNTSICQCWLSSSEEQLAPCWLTITSLGIFLFLKSIMFLAPVVTARLLDLYLYTHQLL